MYKEKFPLLEDTEAGNTTLKLTCGPFKDDLDSQSKALSYWAEGIKEMVEQDK